MATKYTKISRITLVQRLNDKATHFVEPYKQTKKYANQNNVSYCLWDSQGSFATINGKAHRLLC